MEYRFLLDLQTFLTNNMLLIFFFLVAILILWAGIVPHLLFKRLGIPGPTPLPFIGNLIDLIKMKEELLLHEHYVNKYGRICGFYLGMRPFLLITDAEMIKQIMIKEFNKFVNRPLAGISRDIPPTDKGLFQLVDDDWRRIRTTIASVFSSSKIKQVMPLINSSSATLVKVFGKAAETEGNINVCRTYNMFTLEVMMSTAFGLESNTQTNPEDVFAVYAKSLFRVSGLASNLMLIFPFLRPLLQLYYVYLGGIQNTKLGKSVMFFVETARHMVKQRQGMGHSVRKDLLELMLSAEMKDEQGNKVQKLSEDEAVAQCFTFLLAGNETTSNSLSFTSYLLALNQDKQEKLFEEIDSIYDGKSEVSYDLVQSMKYLDRVISESLRLYPTPFRYGRLCNDDCTVNGVQIKKGMGVLFPVYAIHRDPEYWPDPSKFEPERFTAEAMEQRHPFCYVPFGGGPRMCIAVKLALMESKVALIYLLKKYRLERCPETEVPVDLESNVTLTPRNGIFLRICKR